jgi:hypothetical protein
MNDRLNLPVGLLLASLITLATACTNNKGGDTDTEEPDVETGDTEPDGPDYLEPTGTIILAQFGYDPVTDRGVPINDGTRDVPVVVDFLIFNDDWDYSFADEDNYCIIEFVMPGSVERALWAGSSLAQDPVEEPETDAPVDTDTEVPPDTDVEPEPEPTPAINDAIAWGFDVPLGMPAAVANCNEVLDPDEWPDLVGDIEAIQWSFGVSKTLEPGYRQQLIDGGATAADLSTYGGSGLAGLFGELYDDSGYSDSGLLFVNQTNDDFVLQYDAGETIPYNATDVYTDDRLIKGAYNIQVILPFDAISQILDL